MTKWIFIFLLALIFQGECTSSRKIPPTFHWIHLDPQPLSKEEVESIKSWQMAHPHWTFKVWTNAKCSLKDVKICKIHPAKVDLEELKQEILFQEGGVWIHPDMLACKSLNFLTYQYDHFISSDLCSIEGAAPRYKGLKNNILPADFILPDQVFTTQISPLDQSGVCFKRFQKYPNLTTEHCKIQGALIEKHWTSHRLTKSLSRALKVSGAIAGLILINGALLVFLFSKMKKKQFFRIVQFGSFCVALALLYPTFKSLQIKKAKQTNLFYQWNRLKAKPLGDEDEQCIQLCHQLFSTSFQQLTQPTQKIEIPHVIHFIWGGKNPFPEKSIKNILSWKAFHPNWVFKFWTDDLAREVPVEGMEKHLFSELQMPHIGSLYPKAQNWGERSDLLRYEILYQEGGIYVDHDIECYRTFSPLCGHLSLFASLEPLHPSPLYKKEVIITNCLIGSKSKHPVLLNTMEKIHERWEDADQMLPYNDRISSLLRTLIRTFDSFHDAINELNGTENILIFPAAAVFPDKYPKRIVQSLQDHHFLFANHQWDNSWLKELPEVRHYQIPDSLKNQINSLSKICHNVLKFNLFVLSLLLLITSAVLVHQRRVRKYEQKGAIPSSVLPHC